MKVELDVLVPAPVEVVFDFLDDPANMLRLSEHASEHTVGIDKYPDQPDGRKTVDFRMRSGKVDWVHSVEQVLRERPSRLVTRSWTWTQSRSDHVLSLISDRRLTAESGGTRLATTIEYRPGKSTLFENARLWLQRGATRVELEHQLHLLAERLASRDISEP